MTTFDSFRKSVRGESIGVIGFGVSNRPLVRLLADSGAKVTVFDKKPFDELGAEAADLRAEGVDFATGEGYLDGLSGCATIFRTPGLLPTAPQLRKAAANGTRVTSEMEVFFETCPCMKVGVTGSDGKTTTTTVIAKTIAGAGRTVHLGGNIGNPLLASTGDMDPEDVAVLELSSFQLMDMKRSPEVAVVTNVSPNHLDKHKDMAEYVNAKKSIFVHQNNNALLVANLDNEVTRSFLSEAKGRTAAFSRLGRPEHGVWLENGELYTDLGGQTERIMSASDILIPGRHNVENYMAAAAATWAITGSAPLRRVAGTFGGVEHRLEFVRELGGVKYFNSSMDSSPTRTLAAVSSFEGKLIIIAGGYDKHIPYEPLGKPFLEKAKACVLIADTAPMIRRSLEQTPGYSDRPYPIENAVSLAEAVEKARGFACPGDTVILSPASASFGWFKDYDDRGKQFKALVAGLRE